MTGSDASARDAAGAEPAIRTRGLSKRFGRRTAVDGVDLTVPRGAVFGFLGPNGSGKTTTIRMLLGLAGATSGDVQVLGRSMPRAADEVLPRVGALVEGAAFYPFLSGASNLRRFDAADRRASRATRAVRVADAIERVGLGHAAHKQVHAYSLGMKQRLGIAQALLSPRELLVLDEPTNGLDPQGTREVRALIRSLADDGATVFVSSHLLSEIEQMCTHAAVLRAGRLVAQGTIDQLRRSGRAQVRVQTPDADAAGRILAGFGFVVGSGHPDGWVIAQAPHDEDGADGAAGADSTDEAGAGAPAPPAPEQIVAALVGGGVRVRGFAVDEPSLEDRFVELTGEGFDVAG
ncbi:ATP-binding cassette domain-containing protein [Microbacterium kribbense]|uniref:ABC transporter ATP-binding protein n=1 Tax=Microbacterium kribbense TaxID=433645 RepID=UPI003CD059DA